MDEFELSFISNSPLESQQLAEEIANYLTAPLLILCAGDLGTGKTLFVKSLAVGLGYQGEVSSPTFNLVQEYQGSPELIHMDLYRLQSEAELFTIGFEDYLNRNAIILIEWPEIAFNLIPADFIYLKLEKLAVGQRKISFQAEGEGCQNLLERLKNNVNFGN